MQTIHTALLHHINFTNGTDPAGSILIIGVMLGTFHIKVVLGVLPRGHLMFSGAKTTMVISFRLHPRVMVSIK